MTSILCKLGLHKWYDDVDKDDSTPIIVCARCRKSEIKPSVAMKRIGWIGHQNS